MLACYYSQGKQLASGVIGLLTCQSHYNVSVINTTPCARLLLPQLLDQRIATSGRLHTHSSLVRPHTDTHCCHDPAWSALPPAISALCFTSWVAESAQVPAGVRNEGLMSSTIRG